MAVNEGDTLLGTLVDATEAWSDQRTNNGKNPERGWYPLLTIGEITEATGYPDDVRELKVHGFGSVLYNEIMRHRPDIGENVRITYEGQGKGKRGLNPPELYTVRIAGRVDQAKRAYDRIDEQTGATGATTSTAADFTQGKLADEAAEDNPF